MDNIIDPSHNFLEFPTHPLKNFFLPKSIALIGATTKENSVGLAILENLIGKFEGEIYPINPKRKEIKGLTAYPGVTYVKKPIDLAIIATPAKTIPGIIDELAKAKIDSAIIISAGFKEIGEEGAKLEEEVLQRAKKGNVRLLGPNCMGLMNPMINLNATFASPIANKGYIAFLSQSGALCSAVLDWSFKQKIKID